MFVEIGLFPNTGFALDLVDTNERGEIIVDSHCRTGVRGVFAAGDCTDTHDKQIVISVGEGAKAALAPSSTSSRRCERLRPSCCMRSAVRFPHGSSRVGSQADTTRVGTS